LTGSREEATVTRPEDDDFGNVLTDIFRESSPIMAVCVLLGLLAGLGGAACIVWSWPVLETRPERRIQAVFAAGVVLAGLFVGLLVGLLIGGALDALVTALRKAAKPPRKRRRRLPRRRRDEDDDVGLFRPLPPD
jgi:MFS superfamily sulfate permease-like transporter